LLNPTDKEIVMRKFILSTLALATLASPVAALAQRGEIQEDRREVRREYRDLQAARQYGDRGDIREERGEYRDARRELREDVRDRDDRRYDRRYDNDRRGDRYEGRRYQGGAYYHPRGYAYRNYAVGAYLPRAYWADRYYIGRPAQFGLGNAWRGTRWVRVGGDALLIRIRNGAVLQVVRGIYY